MEIIDQKIRYVKLINIYKELLTHTQSDVLVDYYCYDLSYSEIAANRKISRSAVEDALKKGIKKIDEFESKLHILESKEEILKTIAEMKKTTSKNEYLEQLEALERKINNGI